MDGTGSIVCLVLIASTPSTGFYNWNPIPKTPSTNCKIRITDVGNLYSDMSDVVFSILPETNINVLSPNGGESLTLEASQKVTWTSANIRKVKIDYSINNGADWVVITDSIESTGRQTEYRSIYLMRILRLVIR